VRRVLVITTNLNQASFRLRIDALRPLLARRGFDLDVQVRPQNLIARWKLLQSARDYHAVLLQRKLIDPIDARLLRRRARKIFFDLDDAVMFHNHEVGLLSRWRTDRRFDATVDIVDQVVAGNDYLAAMFHQRGRTVTVLPTCIDPARYRIKEHANATPVGLVWIGSASTLPYLAERMDALAEANQRVKIKLTVIADRMLDPEDADIAEGMPMHFVPWSLEGEADALLRGDIGIAPTPDDRWTRGKCGFKILQYMAAGLPAIASPVGANAEIVRHDESGLLASTHPQWVDAIVRLSSDVNLRRRIGQAGRERVERDYSLPRAADAWAELLAQ
jgi:glycosyltransferase involved in cell wall biosynthesis